jgi:hypothetical protein
LVFFLFIWCDNISLVHEAWLKLSVEKRNRTFPLFVWRWLVSLFLYCRRLTKAGFELAWDSRLSNSCESFILINCNLFATLFLFYNTKSILLCSLSCLVLNSSSLHSLQYFLSALYLG